MQELTINSLMKSINELNFTFYSNDRSRVGKDNRFWNEIEITNLPKNQYLISLFKKIIESSGVVDSILEINNMLFVTYGSDYAYSASYGRQNIPYIPNEVTKIKDIIKFSIKNEVDIIQEKNERLKKTIYVKPE